MRLLNKLRKPGTGLLLWHEIDPHASLLTGQHTEMRERRNRNQPEIRVI